MPGINGSGVRAREFRGIIQSDRVIVGYLLGPVFGEKSPVLLITVPANIRFQTWNCNR